MVLFYVQIGGVDLVLLKRNPYDPIFLQCFDTIGWVILPVKKPIPDTTYNVFGGLLNFTQLHNCISAIILA